MTALIHRARIAAVVALLAAGCSADLPFYDPLGAREPDEPCAADADCGGRRCDPVLLGCVDCLSDKDCAAADRCTAGACVSRDGACRSDADCASPPGACWDARGHCGADATCTYTAATTGAPCDDGDACTASDRCDGRGACKAGQPTACDDANPCTTDGCDPATGCTKTTLDDGTTCGPGSAQCAGGACVCAAGGVEDDCSDGVDGDCDGKLDCEDPDCADQACNDGKDCTAADTCEGTRCVGVSIDDTCRTDNPCLDAVGSCDEGTGACKFTPKLRGTPCDDGNACTRTTTCDGAGSCGGGIATTCETAPAGGCLVGAGSCDPQSGACVYERKPGGSTCDDRNPCSFGETCDTDGVCGNPTSGPDCSTPPSACAEFAGTCNASGQCNWRPRTAGAVCRPANGVCDAEEKCDGVTLDCPADRVLPLGESCRPVAGTCDIAEACDGTSRACPADAFRAANAPCRNAVNSCDQAEVCSGTAAACPDDAKAPVTKVCRPSTGPCDAPDTCDGTNDACPAEDRRFGTDVECRPAAGLCDVAEKCDGTSINCGADLVVPKNTLCRPMVIAGDLTTCDLEDVCDGASKQCVDGLRPAGSACRTQATPCGGSCSGQSNICPGAAAFRKSCREYSECNPNAASGNYWIDPDGAAGPIAPLEVFCDYDSALPTDPQPGTGTKGYTLYKITSAALANDQRAYVAACQAVGMDIVVPRTDSHRARIQAWNGGVIPNIVNILPNAKGSPYTLNWRARCKGNVACNDALPRYLTGYSYTCANYEPSGDNQADSRLYRGDNSCTWGSWNDADYSMAIPGWVICSPNDL